MLTEEMRLDKIEVSGEESYVINLRFVHVIMREGAEVSRQYVRRVITHGDDLSDLPPRAQAIAHTLWDSVHEPAENHEVVI